MGTKFLRGGSTELETDEVLASEDTVQKVKDLLDNPNSPGNIVKTGQMGAAEETVNIDLPDGCSTVGVQLTSTWVGTVQFEGTINGVDYQSIEAATGTGSATSTTSNNIFVLLGAGYKRIRVRVSAYTSGVVGVVLIASIGVRTGIITDPLVTGTNVIGKVNIKRVPVITPTTGTGAALATLDPGADYKLLGIRVNISTGAPLASAETLTVILDANAGVAYDVVLFTLDMGTPAINDVVIPFGGDEDFHVSGDKIVVALSANAGGDTWGCETIHELV